MKGVTPKRVSLPVALLVTTGACLLLAFPMTMAGLEQLALSRRAKPEPVEMTLDELVADGSPPAENTFVRLTRFTPGTNYVETTSSSSTGYYLPLIGERPNAAGARPMVVVFGRKDSERDVSQFSEIDSFTGLVTRGSVGHQMDQMLRRHYPQQNFNSVLLIEPRSRVASRTESLIVLGIGLACVFVAAVAFGLFLLVRRRQATDVPGVSGEEKS